MCDQERLESWAKDQLSRRQFGAVAGAATGAAALAGCSTAVEASGDGTALPSMIQSEVTFETADGTMDAFWVHPSEGKYPAIIFWPDIASIRESKRTMARRLAGEGYAVLVLNPYYRDAAGEQFADFADFMGNEGWPKVTPWRKKHTAEAIMADAKAAVAWLDAQDAVDTSKGIGVEGYCMGGPLTVWSAAAVPDRIKAAASFHGGGLVREGDDMSPHATLAKADASYLIAVAQDDDAKAPEVKDVFAAAAKDAGRMATVTVYPGDHGWTVPDSPAYAKVPAEKAYADKIALYKSAL